MAGLPPNRDELISQFVDLTSVTPQIVSLFPPCFLILSQGLRDPHILRPKDTSLPVLGT